jgi:hypothetical protein
VWSYVKKAPYIRAREQAGKGKQEELGVVRPTGPAPAVEGSKERRKEGAFS